MFVLILIFRRGGRVLISLHGLVNMTELSFICTMCDVKTETEQEIKVHILDTHLKEHLANAWPSFKGISVVNTTTKLEDNVSITSKSFQESQSSNTDGNKETHGNKLSPNADTVFQINDLALHSPTHHNKEVMAKEADSDLFCPFASACSFDTNTTQKLKRHLESLHPNITSFSCIFPSCDFASTHSLKLYSTHLRSEHAEQVKTSLASLREKRSNPSDIFSMKTLNDNNDKLGMTVTNGTNSNRNTFLIMPASEENQFQPVIKTKSVQIIQGATDNGMIAVSSSDFGSVQAEQTNANTDFGRATTILNKDKLSCFSNASSGQNINNECCLSKNYQMGIYSNTLLSFPTLTNNSNMGSVSSYLEANTLSKEGSIDPKVIDVIREDIEDDNFHQRNNSKHGKGIEKPNLATKINKMLETVIQDSRDAEEIASIEQSTLNAMETQNALKKDENPGFPLLPLHQCNICYKILISKGGLKRHIRSVHNEDIYTCKECPFSTRSPSQLGRHQKKHGITTEIPPKESSAFL